MHSKNPHEDCKSWRTVWNWQFLSQLTSYTILINKVALIDYGRIKSNPSTLNAIPLEHVFIVVTNDLIDLLVGLETCVTISIIQLNEA